MYVNVYIHAHTQRAHVIVCVCIRAHSYRPRAHMSTRMALHILDEYNADKVVGKFVVDIMVG